MGENLFVENQEINFLLNVSVNPEKKKRQDHKNFITQKTKTPYSTYALIDTICISIRDNFQLQQSFQPYVLTKIEKTYQLGHDYCIRILQVKFENFGNFHKKIFHILKLISAIYLPKSFGRSFIRSCTSNSAANVYFDQNVTTNFLAKLYSTIFPECYSTHLTPALIDTIS